jgi:multiple sugar transport system substrate-binding protein
MAKKRSDGISRRDFLKITSAGAVAAGVGGPYFLFPERSAAQQKTLKILQWSHFVPDYDKWFDQTYTKQWGQKNNTNVVVDHINLNDLVTRARAEVAAQKGHDLFMFLSPPAAYENQVIDHSEIYQEVQKKHGKPVTLGVKSTFNPKSKKYFAFSDSYVPDPGNYRVDWWSQVGFPKGPDTYDDLLKGAAAIKQKFQAPCGVGLSQELDTNMAMRACLWSFGGSVQDEAGNVTINSKNTIEALKYMRELFKQAQTPEVFTWDPSSNNRAILSGRASFVENAISVTRQAEREGNKEMSEKIQICKALKGPGGRWAAEHVMDCYVIWKFAENKEGAKKFLIEYIDNFNEGFKAGGFYNFPCFPSVVPDLQKAIANDPKATPPDKYKVLSDVLDWATNVGHPGYATAAIDEVFNTFVVPTMFAKVARDLASPEESAKAAEAECKRIFAKWK